MILDEKKKLFASWGYGLFIHYGVYSVYGLGEWLMYSERMDVEDYFKNALPQFKPDRNHARKWVDLAKRGGMKYAVLTTRHHEGYFIGDDLVNEFVTACRENNLGVGLYYSVADWSDPNFRGGPTKPGWALFVEKAHRQVKEIMTSYGKIDYLFYDGCPPPATWDLKGLHKEIRAIQPEMLICRCHEDTDLQSCEGHSNGAADQLWESCYTLNDSWGYNKFDHNWKPAEKVINMLSDNRSNGGNLLLNVGPMANGEVQQEAVAIIETVGQWLEKNGEGIYNVSPHPFDYHDHEISTLRDNTVYIRLIRDYPVRDRRIGGIGNKVKSIKFVATNEDINFSQQDDVITMTDLAPKKNNELPRMIKLEIEGAPIGIPNPMKPDCDIKVTGE